MLVAFALIGGSALIGPAGAQTPTPTPTATGPAAPKINFLNPAQGYDPQTDRPPRTPGTADPPKVSDRDNGVTSAYHIVAATDQAVPNAVVEAYIKYGSQNEITIGTLDPIPGSTGYELLWDIPDSLNEGSATMFVRIFQQTGSGFVPVAEDSQVVDMQHKGSEPAPPPDQPADDTVAFTWPTQNGRLGFYKPAGAGAWRTVVDYSVSNGGSEMNLLYSVTDPGAEPVYKACGRVLLFNDANGPTVDGPGAGPIKNQGICSLTGNDLPTDVSAIAAVVLEGDQPNRNDVVDSSMLTQDSADVHLVQGYAVDNRDLKLELRPVAPSAVSATYPTSLRRTAGSGCLNIDAVVLDDLDRPVQGPNVDVHLEGPDDQVGFTAQTGAAGTSGQQAPQKDHSNESERNCTGGFTGTQGDHNLPGAGDVKHIESTLGAGQSGPAQNAVIGGARPGTWRFGLFSPTVGFSDVTAWVDEESLDSEGKRMPDGDTLEGGESKVSVRAQWLPSGVSLSFQPSGRSALPGTCTPMTVRARAGTAALPNINLDVHATGPDDNLDFCDLTETSPRRAPDAPDTGHNPEDTGEAGHGGSSPRAQHTEGETDDAGNFTVGVVSPTATGDSRLEAWIDGEPAGPADNDTQDANEARAAATVNWAATLAQAQLSFVSPSPYGSGGTPGAGSGTRVASTQDADRRYHVSVRVNAVGVPGVELLISQDGTTFRKLGDMTQVSQSDLWEFSWNVDATEDTSPTLRAQIPGTDRREDIVISVNNQGSDIPPPGSRAYETAEITSPIAGTEVAFTNRVTKVKGVASAGAEGLELYYTKASANDTPAAADWILCGFLQLDGLGTAPQNFEADCTLNPSDQAGLVTGVAVITFDCSPIVINDGCDARPTGQTPARQGEKESGDAHRIYGFEAQPLITLEPAESQGATRSCQPLQVAAVDQTGQALGGENVDVHLQGPDDEASFCQPQGGSTRRAPDQGGHVGGEPDEGIHPDTSPETHHTEGETRPNGAFTFGITTNNRGNSNVTVWLDRNDNDVADGGEASDVAVLHWFKRASGSGGKKCTQRGTPGRDVLTGTSAKDILCGLGGRDKLVGLGNADTLNGGKGNDRLLGGRGNDRISGAEGDDFIKGGRGRDKLNGGLGRDRLSGGGQRDFCAGGRGRDRSKGCETKRS